MPLFRYAGTRQQALKHAVYARTLAKFGLAGRATQLTCCGKNAGHPIA